MNDGKASGRQSLSWTFPIGFPILSRYAKHNIQNINASDRITIFNRHFYGWLQRLRLADAILHKT